MYKKPENASSYSVVSYRHRRHLKQL